MPGCAVPGCNNGTGARRSNPDGVRYHVFPKERGMALKWWQIIRRADTELDEHADPRVCSVHFKPSDFVTAPTKSRRNLIPEAIPSIIPPSTSSSAQPAVPASSSSTVKPR